MRGHKVAVLRKIRRLCDVSIKARLARIRIAKASSGAAFVSKKKAAEARLAAQESGVELDDAGRDEDIFELQHHHLLRCLERTTDREFVEMENPFNGAAKRAGSPSPLASPAHSGRAPALLACCARCGCCPQKYQVLLLDSSRKGRKGGRRYTSTSRPSDTSVSAAPSEDPLPVPSVWQIHSCREHSARKPDRCCDGWDLLSGGVLLGPVHHSHGDLCIAHASETITDMKA
ncbi:hypothetical protein SFRURICE_017144 [Spodoptera frugiperda]|nr:hypothetical protein SFRURICE_017144 [Spodoptera frugiperda]